MAKYTFNGNSLSIDFTEDGIDEVVTADLDGMTDAVQQASARFGLKTVLRNSTAGKMDNPADALKALKARLATLESGKWAEEGEGTAKVELTDDERAAVIQGTICIAYGKPANDAEMLKKLAGASESTMGAILAKLKPQIDKALKQALSKKKAAAKSKVELPGLEG